MRAYLAALLLFAATTTHAQSPPDALTQAKEHYRRGTQLYDLGQFADAAREYVDAFKLTDKPGFLFNIGQAYRLAGKTKDAAAAYEGFLRRVPESPMRAEVEEYLATLSKKMEQDAAAQQKRAAEESAAQRAAPPLTPVLVLAPPTAAEPARVPTYKKWWLWTIVGVVAAGAATGIAVGLTQSNRTTGTIFNPATFQ